VSSSPPRVAITPADAAGDRDWLTSPVECGSAAGFGVYLHVPFCHHRCGYCDFAVAAVGGLDPARRDDLEGRYVAAIRADLARQVAAGRRAHAPPDADHLDDRWPEVTSVFVGGGTPTLLSPERLSSVIASVGEELDLAAEVEVPWRRTPRPPRASCSRPW